MSYGSDPGEIILFVKNPEPGRVKTRLARTVGIQTAVQIYSHMSRTLFWRLQSAGLNPVVAFYPVQAKKSIQKLFPGAKAYVPQVSGNLGKKMDAALRSRMQRSSKLLLIGTDCIDLSPIDCREALQALDRNPVVLGPAADGGYYLLGIRSSALLNDNVAKALFEKIDWSTPRVLKQTMQRLKVIQIKCTHLSVKSDLDLARDLKESTLRSLFGAPQS